MYSNGPGSQLPQGQPMPVHGGPRPTNSMAIAALVSSLVIAPLGIVLGHISMSQIKRSGEDGRGLAIAGLAIGYLGTVIGAIWLIVVLTSLSALDSALDGTVDTTVDTTTSSATPTLLPPNSQDRAFEDVAASICGVVTQDEISELNGRDLPAGHELDPTSSSDTCSYATSTNGYPAGAGVTCHDLTADSSKLSFFTKRGVAQSGTASSGQVEWFTTEKDQFVFYSSTTLCVTWSVASGSSTPSSMIDRIAARLVS